MNRLAPTIAAALLSLAWALPASAKDFVQDQAGMFSAAAVAQLNQEIASFNSGTGKEVLVVTVPSLPSGVDLATAAQQAASQQSLNGVLIYIAKDDRKDIIVPGQNEAQSGWFTRDTIAPIRQAMESSFKSEDYDGGITSAVGNVLGIYRSHLGSLHSGNAYGTTAARSTSSSTLGGHGMFFWLIVLFVGFMIFRSLTRPRFYGGQMPPGGPAGPGYPGGGYGGPGYYGGGGGGGFWSGMLGGLGGAFLGNELFGGRGGFGGGGGSMVDPGSSGGGAPDGGGWGNDGGQVDMGQSSGGDWGGGGFGDFGGGGGGGGGDMGGGW